MSNDKYILYLLEDYNYRILRNGQIETCLDRGGHRRKHWRVKSFKQDAEGYLRIRYKKKTLAIHRIIYAAFNGPLNPTLVINHIDGNPGNNSAENLELITQAENNLHRFRTLRHPPVNGNAKLSADDAAEIRRLVAEENVRACDLARKYGVGKSTISMLITGKTWK